MPLRTFTPHGALEVICGPMFSGKSEEMIRRIKRAELAKLNVIVFKHCLDDRTMLDYVVSHNGNKIKAIPVEHPNTILTLTPSNAHVVGIDEVQFFSSEILNIVCALVEQGKRVIVAGLDRDFKGKPFGPMPTLLAIADNVIKLKAICMDCGDEAPCTQRLVNGQPARYDDPIVLIGAQESYQARCRNCHLIDKQPTFNKDE